MFYSESGNTKDFFSITISFFLFYFVLLYFFGLTGNGTCNIPFTDVQFSLQLAQVKKKKKIVWYYIYKTYCFEVFKINICTKRIIKNA